MGLLTTAVLMGIMAGFLGTLLLQLIKLTPRGLLQPCNDYFFFPMENRKSDLKVIWWAFFPFSDVEGFEWKPELKPQTRVWEQSTRWGETGTEGRALLQGRMEKTSQYHHPSYQFLLLPYFFSVFLLLCASHLELAFVSELQNAFSKETANCFVLLCLFILSEAKG